jgi:hypothetical protein
VRAALIGVPAGKLVAHHIADNLIPKLVWWQTLDSEAKALEAAGLRE